MPVIVVQHRHPFYPNLLATVLQRHTKLFVKAAVPDDRPLSGVVYVAPPDRHLVISRSRRFALGRAMRIHYLVSAADPLFESAARAFGGRTIAVILTGSDGDGARGALAVHKAGGIVLAQDEASSVSFGMPLAAIATGAVDAVLPLNEIGPALVRLAQVKPARRAAALIA
jgi:two-component system chemotaxis response regulator CheB